MFRQKKNIFQSKKFRINRGVPRFTRSLGLKKEFLGSRIFKILNLILILGIISCVYFFIFSNFYDITNIEVGGNQIISTADVLDITNSYLAQRTFLILKKRNIFIFNRSQLKDKINQVVILDDLKIEKILPNTIRLTIREKNAALKWLNNDHEYLVDGQGMIIKRFYKLEMPSIYKLVNQDTQAPAPPVQTNDNFITIINQSAQGVNLGDKVLRPEDVKFIDSLTAKAGAHNMQIQSISVPNVYPQFIQVQLNGWQAFFNLKDSLDNQLSRLDLVISQKIKKENLSRLDYIDLRLGESIYYKFKDQPAAQTK